MEAKPVIFHIAEGDILECFYETDEDYYAEWVNPMITLLRSQHDKHIVGVQIWGYNTWKCDDYQNAGDEE